jgi:hypothetical protein
MRMPYRHHWLLWGMNRSLSRSDPHMAAMLAIFARLNAGEPLASREQARQDTRLGRGLACLGAAVAGIACAVAGIAICLAEGARRVLRRVAIACAVARWRLSGGARAALSASSDSRPPTYPGRTGRPAS